MAAPKGHEPQAESGGTPRPGQRKSNRWKTLGKWTLLIIAVLCLLLALTLGALLGTEKGRLWLLHTGVDLGLGEGALQVTFEGERAPALGEWTFERVLITREGETFADLRQLHLKWSPAELLHRRLKVYSVGASRVHLVPDAGTPAEEPEVAEETEGGAQLPPVSVDNFEVGRLSVQTDAQAVPDYRLAGDLRLFWDDLPLQINLDARSLAPQDTADSRHAPMQLSLRTRAATERRFTLAGRLQEDAGGLIGEFLHLPSGNDIDAGFEAVIQARSHAYDITLQRFEMPFLHRLLAAEGELSLNLDGPAVTIDRLHLRTDEQAHHLSGTASAEQLDLQVELNGFPLDVLSPWVPDIDEGQLSATLSVAGAPAAPEVTGRITGTSRYGGQPVELATAGRFNLSQLVFEQLALDFGEAKLQAQGQVDLEGAATDLQFTLADFPSAYLAIAGVNLPTGVEGRLDQAEGRITGHYLDPRAQLTASGRGRYRQRDFTLRLEGTGSHSQVALAQAELQLEDAALLVQGTIDLEGDQSDLRVQADKLPLELIQLADLDLPQGLEDLSALIDAKVRLKGALTAPVADGSLQAAGSYRGQAFNLQVDGAGDPNRVQLHQVEMTLGEARLAAQGSVDLKGRETDLTLDLNEVPLSLAALADVELPENLAATLNGSVHVAGALAAPRAAGELHARGSYQGQSFAVDLAGRGDRQRATIEQAQATLGQASLQASGSVDLVGDQTDVEVVLDNAPLELLELAQVTPPEDLSAELSGYASIRGALQSPQVDSRLHLTGVYSELPFNLIVNGSLAERRLNLDEVQLTINGATALAAQGYLQPDAYDLQVSAHDLPSRTLSALGWDLITGDFNGELRVKGTPQQPNIEGSFTYSGQLAGLDMATGERTQFELGWHTQMRTTEEQVLDLVSEFERDQQETGRFQLRVPLADYLTHIQDDGAADNLPLAFDANGAVDLAVLSLILDPDLHRISGRAALRMNGDGRLSEPNLNGVFELLDVTYENALSGTSLTDIQLLLQSSGTRITIAEASAGGGGNGRLGASGAVDWSDPNDDDAVDIQVTAQSANLINREDIDGEISGDLALTGSFQELWLRGEVNVMPLSANIDAALQSSIPEIEVTEVYGDPEDQESEGEALTLGPKINLDLTIEAEQQAYLRGRGLEAELRGEILLRGTLDEPTYEGEFSIVRGIFEVFGRKFDLEQGEVMFANNALYMLIPGQYEHDDYTIRAELSGTVEDLALSLTSVPDLPEDEILSLLIFGESAQNISAFQALRLATAVQTLRGGSGGGFDPIGSTRDMLGVDRLSVETASTGTGTGVAVGVGKYINERVYLEVRRTPDENQPWEGNVEVELTPRLRLRSTTGGDGRTGAEFLWKRDF